MEKTEDTEVQWKDVQYIDKVYLKPDLTAVQVTTFYNEWANSGTYEQVMSPTAYGCPLVLRQAMVDLYPANREAVKVLEIGAGTGLAGKLLYDVGFTNLDALDPAMEMLDVARKKGIYRQFFNVPLTADPVDLPAGTYDAVVLVGLVGYGHLPCDAFLEITRLVKSGGYIVNCMRAEKLQNIPEYAERWETLMTRMIQENMWKVVKYEKYPNHFLGREGLLMVFQVNK